MEKTTQPEPHVKTRKESIFDYLRTVRDAITPSLPKKIDGRREFLLDASKVGMALPFIDKKEVVKSILTAEKQQIENNTLPNDIISDEVLKQHYHIETFNVKGDDFVELQFRESAKETKLFKRLEKGARLSIILVDDHKVDQNSLSAEQKAVFEGRKATILRSLETSMQRAKDANLEEINRNRAEKIDEYQKKKAELQETYSGDALDAHLQALDYTYSRYLKDPPSEEDQKIGLRVSGHTVPFTETVDKKPVAHAYVFMAVRNMPQEKIFKVGKESVVVPSKEATYSTNGYEPDAPDPSQSYIDPDTAFTIDMDQDKYIVTWGRTPGDTLRHELQHASGVIDEKGADTRALQELEDASRRYKEEQDDSAYWVVFKTPQGVTITQNTRNQDVV